MGTSKKGMSIALAALLVLTNIGIENVGAYADANPPTITGTIGSGTTGAGGISPDIPTSYCTAGYKFWEDTGSVSVMAEGNCSHAIEQISVQAILYSNDGNTERANSGVQTGTNGAILDSNPATSQCGSSCGSWNWWIGVIFVSFTSSDGWSGGTTGWCAVTGDTMNCDGDTSTFNYTL